FAQPVGGRDERRKQVGPDRRGHVDVRPGAAAHRISERTETLIVGGEVEKRAKAHRPSMLGAVPTPETGGRGRSAATPPGPGPRPASGPRRRPTRGACA